MDETSSNARSSAMPSTSANADVTTLQERRAEMRERYLRFIAALGGSNATISMFEKTRVSGRVAAVRVDGADEQCIIEDLQTPMGKHECAVLRLRDVVSIAVDWSEINRPRDF